MNQVVGSDNVERVYFVEAAIEVDLLATLDPVTGGPAPLLRALRLPKGKIPSNVLQFENFYERRGGSTQFDLYFPGRTDNGDAFNPIWFAGQEDRTPPLTPLIKGAPLKYSLPPNKVKQLNLTDGGQVAGNRHASNVEYWKNNPQDDPVGSDHYDAALTASGVEHLYLPWYVRGGVNGIQGNYDYDSNINVLLDVHNI